jgi:hypothetical protein
MAASTVSYIDTTGNKDYLGMIAGQIGRRLKEASDMASNERAFAEGKAEGGGTSLSEAGIGKGYFFKRALGSRFGGDRIARTKGRMGMGGAGTDPTGNFRSRFRGGFDYNVTNEIQAANAPLSGAVVSGLRGVESGLVAVSQSLKALSSGMSDLARSQEDAAKQAILNGAFMQAFLNHMQREGARQRAGKEERGLERGLLGGGSGGGSGRGMINVTPPSGGSSGPRGADLGDVIRGGVSLGTDRSALRASSAGFKVIKATDRASVMRKAVKAAKISDKFVRPVTKGMVNMGTKMPGVNAVTNLFRGSEKLLGSGGKLLTKKAFSMNPFKIKKIAKELVTGGDGVKPLAKLAEVAVTGDHTGTLTEVAKSGRNIKKAYSGASIAGASKSGLNAVTYSPDMMNAIKTGDNINDGLSSAKTLAAAADAGAPMQMLKRFILGTKPKGLMKGSKLTRLLVKNPAGKMFLKKLPIIGALAGAFFAAQRLMEGDFLGAGLELGSGLLGAVGAAPLSLGLDGFLLARDFGAVPFAKGGITKGPTNALIGEQGREAVFPLDGTEGKKTFKAFGEGNLNARLDNKGEDSNLLALGHKRYYETMGGWKSFGEGLLEAFGGMKDKVGDTLANVNPFSAENLSKVNNSSASNSIRSFIGSEVGDGYIGPKWMGIKNPLANEQANALNNNSAQTSMGSLFMPTTIINNYSTVAAGGDGGSGEGGDSSFPSGFQTYALDYSLYSK